MPTISRNTKGSAGGGTAWLDATLIEADEHNADHDTVYNVINGNLDNDNIAASAGIDPTKLDDYSGDATERRTETSPGVTGSESDATTMAGELERVRYKLKELGLGTSTARQTSDDVYWIDTPMTGPNLIRNGNFAVGLESSVPPGWTNVNTATLALTTAGKTEGQASMRALRITAAGGTDEGVSQTLAGLKASTKYVVGCRAKATSGDTFKLVTTGADGSTFGNLSLSTTSTSYVTLAGVIVTDSTPTDIVVQLLAAADGDIVDVTHVWVRECSGDRLPFSSTAWGYSENTTNTADHYADGTFTDSGLTAVTVVPPGPGYFVEVHAKATISAGTFVGANAAIQLRENGSAVDSAHVAIESNDIIALELHYIKRDPIPGTTYSYTLFGAGDGDAVGRNFGAESAIDGETARTYIRARAVLESGF